MLLQGYPLQLKVHLNRYYGMRSIYSGESRGDWKAPGNIYVKLAEDQGRWVTRSTNELDAKGRRVRRAENVGTNLEA